MSEAATLVAAALYGYGWLFLSVVLSPWSLSPEEVGFDFAYLLVRVTPVALIIVLPAGVLLRWLRDIRDARLSIPGIADEVPGGTSVRNDKTVAHPSSGDGGDGSTSASIAATPNPPPADIKDARAVAWSVIRVGGSWLLGILAFFCVLGVIGGIGEFLLRALLRQISQSSYEWLDSRDDGEVVWIGVGFMAILGGALYVIYSIARWSRGRSISLKPFLIVTRYLAIPLAVLAILASLPVFARNLAAERVAANRDFSLGFAGIQFLSFRSVTIESLSGNDTLPSCAVLLGRGGGEVVLVEPGTGSVLLVPEESITIRMPCAT